MALPLTLKHRPSVSQILHDPLHDPTSGLAGPCTDRTPDAVILLLDASCDTLACPLAD